MEDRKTLTLPASTEVSLEAAQASFAELREAGPMRSLLRAGLSLSEMSDPRVQRALVDATIMDSMLNATQTTKGGDVVTDYKERRQAAKDLAKIKGYDTGESKRRRVLEEVDAVKRFLAAEIVVEKKEE